MNSLIEIYDVKSSVFHNLKIDEIKEGDLIKSFQMIKGSPIEILEAVCYKSEYSYDKLKKTSFIEIIAENKDFKKELIISTAHYIYVQRDNSIMRLLANDLQDSDSLIYLDSCMMPVFLKIVSIQKYEPESHEKVYNIRCMSSNLIVNGLCMTSLTGKNEGVLGNACIALVSKTINLIRKLKDKIININ